MSATRRKRWSLKVTQTSNALDLETGVFSKKDPRDIARSLKRSAERSHRRKSAPFASAMSMLTFYVNRAGKTLSKQTRRRLERAKEELRSLYRKERTSPNRRRRMAASICIDFYLVSWLIVGRAWVASAAAGLFALFLTLWFVLPRSRLLLRLIARGDLEPAGNPARG
jgi:hypothetical protein